MSLGLPVGAPSPLFLRDEAVDRAGLLIALVHRALVEDTAATLERSGLSRQDAAVLDLVVRQEGLGVADLVPLVGLSKQSLSRIVQDLVARELLRQGASGIDARRRPLVATEAARVLVGEMDTARRRRLRRAFKAVGAEAVAGFERILGELLDPSTRRLLEAAVP